MVWIVAALLVPHVYNEDNLLPVDTFLFNGPKANRNGRLKLLYVLLHGGYTLH